MGDPNSVVRSRNSNCPNALATPQVWRFHKLTMERENQSVLTAGAAVAGAAGSTDAAKSVVSAAAAQCW